MNNTTQIALIYLLSVHFIGAVLLKDKVELQFVLEKLLTDFAAFVCWQFRTD